MKKHITLFIVILVSSCQSEKHRDVGNIPFDSELDSSEFKICDENIIKEYYIRRSSDTAPSYKDEKRGLEEELLNAYSYPVKLNQNGYITIRFIVNCKGESGRFRMEQMNLNYKPFKFDKEISNQLFSIVKKLKYWIPRSNKGQNFDFYQYLTFKIINGQIIKILP